MAAAGPLAWVEALDDFAAELARQRTLLEEMAADADASATLPGLNYQFPSDLGPMPPDLATYARAVLADSLLLEEQMAKVSASIAGELGSMRTATRRYRAESRQGHLDRDL
jgi:hypothetical protein